MNLEQALKLAKKQIKIAADAQDRHAAWVSRSQHAAKFVEPELIDETALDESISELGRLLAG